MATRSRSIEPGDRVVTGSPGPTAAGGDAAAGDAPGAPAAIPWQERPAGGSEVVWRSSRNPIIARDQLARSNSIFNSAVVPFRGAFAGVFRVDDRSRSMNVHAGRSDAPSTSGSCRATPKSARCSAPTRRSTGCRPRRSAWGVCRGATARTVSSWATPPDRSCAPYTPPAASCACPRRGLFCRHDGEGP